jgi:hypothetical protein
MSGRHLKSLKVPPNCFARGNGFTAKLYPTAMRASGVGAALGIGQVGTIIGPALGGAMFALGVSVATILFLAALPPFISSVSIITLWHRGRAASIRRRGHAAQGRTASR